MRLQIRWKDCDRSKAVESAIEDSVAILEKYSFIQDNVKVEIVFYPKTKVFKSRINIQVIGGRLLRAEAASPTIYGATNAAVDKLEDQLRRVKTKFMKNK